MRQFALLLLFDFRKKLYRNLGAIAKKQSSAGPQSENMAPVTLTVLTAVLLLARDVNSQDDSDDDDGTEGEYLNSPTFPKQKKELLFFFAKFPWLGRLVPGGAAASANP